MYELGIRVTVQSLGKKNLTYELFTAEYGQVSDKSCFFLLGNLWNRSSSLLLALHVWVSFPCFLIREKNLGLPENIIYLADYQKAGTLP